MNASVLEILTGQCTEPKSVSYTVSDTFKELFYEHFQNLCDYSFTMVKDPDQAKDIVQSAFAKLWEKRTGVDLENAGRSYLFTSVYRASLNAIRNRKAKEQHHLQLSRVELAEQYDPSGRSEIRFRVENAVRQLPERCREVFIKAKYEGKRYNQISREMSISVKTVEAQMAKALRFLRENLQDLSTYVPLVLLFL